MRRQVAERLAGSSWERPARAVLARFGLATAWRDLPEVTRRNAVYDRQTRQLVRQRLRPGDGTVDAGAHEGAVLHQLLRAAPGGVHHAFEPLPVLAERLRARFPAAVVHQAALSDHDGTASFRVLPDAPEESSLLVRPDREGRSRVEEIEVPVRRLDSVWPDAVPLRFLKVDVEDAELAVLSGAQGVLERWQPVVVVECHVDRLPPVLDRLEAAGLRPGLLADVLAGRRRDRAALEAEARRDGHWYFAAAP